MNFKTTRPSSSDYTITHYPRSGYIIKENGDITLPDGTLPVPGVAITISNEHLRIAVARKRRAAST
jgi:hypothetical protein